MSKKSFLVDLHDATRTNVFNVDPSTLVIIGLDTDDDKSHPLYDPRNELPMDEAMVFNIMRYGVIQTVSIKREGDSPVVVDGRQRVRCAREANKRLEAEGKMPIKVTVKMKRGNEHELFGVMVSANEHRRQDGVLAKADKAGRMLEMGADIKEVAIAFGVTEQAVRNWLALLDVSSNVRKAVETGTISPSAAAKLSTLSRDEQNEALVEMVESGETTTKAATTRVKRVKTGDKDAVSAPGKRILKRIIDHVNDLDEDENPLSEDFIRALRWAVGDLTTTSIAGLKKLVEEA
jgi:ParB family chromosome partitioning protein